MFNVAGHALPRKAAPQAFATTIHDVAVDGSFPAVGYPGRMTAWAEAVRAAWSEALPPD